MTMMNVLLSCAAREKTKSMTYIYGPRRVVAVSLVHYFFISERVPSCSCGTLLSVSRGKNVQEKDRNEDP